MTKKLSIVRLNQNQQLWLSRFHSKSITSSFALYALCRKILFIQLLFTSREALSACLMLCCSYLILYTQLLPKSLLEVPVWFELQSYQEVRKYKIKTQQVLWVCVVNLGDLLATYRCDTESSQVVQKSSIWHFSQLGTNHEAIFGSGNTQTQFQTPLSRTINRSV